MASVFEEYVHSTLQSINPRLDHIVSQLDGIDAKLERLDRKIEPIDKSDFGSLVHELKRILDEFADMRLSYNLLESSVTRHSAGDLVEILQGMADRLDRRIRL